MRCSHSLLAPPQLDFSVQYRATLANGISLLLHSASSVARRWAARARMRSSWLCCAVGMPAVQRPMYRIHCVDCGLGCQRRGVKQVLSLRRSPSPEAFRVPHHSLRSRSRCTSWERGAGTCSGRRVGLGGGGGGHFPIQSSLTSEACDTRQGARHGCPTSGYVEDTLGLRLSQNKFYHCRLPS